MRSPLLALALCFTCQGPAAETVRIATGEFPPYATATAPDQGLALLIVRRAFAKAGHEVNYHFMPWPRAQAETKIGLWDASAYWGASDERRRDFLLSDNVLTEQWVIVHRRDKPTPWTELTDLRPYTLGIIQGYTYTPELWRLVREGSLKADNTRDDNSGLRKLLLNRIDALPMERGTACDLLLREFKPAEAAKIGYHPRLLTDSFTTHLLLPKDASRSEQLLADFNRGLKELRASGEYQRLLHGVACPPHWQDSRP